MIERILFLTLFSLFCWLLFRRIRAIIRGIRLGRPVNRSDQPIRRWHRVLLLAFGQKKMFKKPVPAALHLIIYLGFIIINIEILEFFIDGLTGSHRIFASLLNNNLTGTGEYSLLYNGVMNLFEFLAFGVLIACIVFLFRRNVLSIKRFSGGEMSAWPVLDANLILVFEIVLMLAILTMNGTDQILQATNNHFPATGPLFFSGYVVVPILKSAGNLTLTIVEKSAWWFHIIGILGFALYVTYSKHLHIIMAFPNTYYSNLRPPAEIPSMEAVTHEVNAYLGLAPDVNPGEGEIPTLGACDVQDLTWKNLMDAFTCTECGRCTAVCPANITGKKLSPRKIVMDVRDRVEEITQSLHDNRSSDNKTLFDRISREELFACTTCNACIEACPVSIDPVSVIIQMRRFTAMEESTSPASWNMMFNNLETNFAPWKFAASDRFKWAEEFNVNNENDI